MWNPNKFLTKEQYLSQVGHYAREVFRGKDQPRALNRTYLPLWWIGGEIRIFWEKDITQSTAVFVKDAIESQISEIDTVPPLTVRLFGTHPSAEGQIDDCTISGAIDWDMLFQDCLSEAWRDDTQGGEQHADVVITTKPFLNNRVSWGCSIFAFGTMILALYGRRQEQRNFLKKVVIHETGHLLGFETHCDSYQNVEGYQYTPDCNMHYSCPSAVICAKCTDYIRQWWVEVRNEYEMFLQRGE